MLSSAQFSDEIVRLANFVAPKVATYSKGRSFGLRIPMAVDICLLLYSFIGP